MTVRVVPTGLTASGCKGPPRGTALDLALLGFCPTEAFFHLALEGVFNLCHKSRAFLPLPKVNWAADDHVAVKRHKNRSEEHTSELQSRGHLVCRLLLEKKK